MHIVLGGTGHIGSVLARLLLDRGEAVTVVTRDPAKAAALRRRGFGVAVVDVHDRDALREVFRRGRRAFLLNPPAPPATDTDAEEKSTVEAILGALDGSGLHKVVAQSTYGARRAEHSGDLGTLHELEQGLARQPIPASVIRGAYYMSNWDAALETARTEGVVHTLFPVEFALPMVDPADLAHVAARLMTEPVERTGLHHVEGPRRYSAADVAEGFAEALGRPVRPIELPRDRWPETFRSLGFSEPAARSYARMTALTLDEPDLPDAPLRGRTSLREYIARLVRPRDA